MKTVIVYISLMMALVSCKTAPENEEQLYPESMPGSADTVSGRELFDEKGNCAACHQPDQKVIGPSIREIADIYKVQNGDIVSFLRGKSEPIVDPAQYEVMKTNFAITKKMSDAELKALEKYIYEHATK